MPIYAYTSTHTYISTHTHANIQTYVCIPVRDSGYNDKGLDSGAIWVYSSVTPLPTGVTLGELISLSGPPFPQLENGENNSNL